MTGRFQVRRAGDGVAVTLAWEAAGLDGVVLTLGHEGAVELVRQLLEAIDEVEDGLDAAVSVGSDGGVGCPGLRFGVGG